MVVLGACGDTDDSDGAAAPEPDASPAAGSTPVPDVAEPATSYFSDLGYATLPALALATGDSFNGGLRYDGSTDSVEKGLRVQPCARLDDLGRNDPGRLALFHQIDVRNPVDGLTNEEGIEVAVGLLVGALGLDPGRLGLVSTELMEPLVSSMTALDLPDAHVYLRPVDEAMAAGDGSGYFNPEGHPAQPELLTTSLHYRVDPASTDPLGHPAGPGWIEIGEMALNVGPQADHPSMVWGFGLERLALAQGGEISTYEQSRLALLAALESEAGPDGELPAGHGAVERDSA
jgi:hypothetical protein